MQSEGALNNLNENITDYLIDISSRTMSEVESEKHSALMDTVRDVERIGDHFENIIELIDYKISNKVIITEHPQEDLSNMLDLTISTVKQVVTSLEQMNNEETHAVIQKADQIDKLQIKYSKNQIIRMNEWRSDGSEGIVFVNILSNLERIGDHAVNIAEEVLH